MTMAFLVVVVGLSKLFCLAVKVDVVPSITRPASIVVMKLKHDLTPENEELEKPDTQRGEPL